MLSVPQRAQENSAHVAEGFLLVSSLGSEALSSGRLDPECRKPTPKVSKEYGKQENKSNSTF